MTERHAFELSDEANILGPRRPETASPSPVCSYNEWDPLEEVIVGRLEGVPASLRLDARELDHLGPFLGSSRDIGAELGGGEDHWDEDGIFLHW
jgi:hypothetical protein